ncbi:MAG: hypothetical protein OXG35_19050, partial [Acidobacteria bacterium]|nr:hypothetical protein [Acidobacteriota bacterium]
ERERGVRAARQHPRRPGRGYGVLAAPRAAGGGEGPSREKGRGGCGGGGAGVWGVGKRRPPP